MAQRFVAKHSLTFTEGGFLFDSTDGESFTVNQSAAVVLRALLQHRESAEVWRDLVEAFDVSEKEARRDAQRFLLQLRALGLVVTANAKNGGNGGANGTRGR